MLFQRSLLTATLLLVSCQESPDRGQRRSARLADVSYRCVFDTFGKVEFRFDLAGKRAVILTAEEVLLSAEDFDE